jgi:hypothetical protein
LQFRQKKDIIEKRKSGSSMAQVGICEMRMVTMGSVELNMDVYLSADFTRTREG